MNFSLDKGPLGRKRRRSIAACLVIASGGLAGIAHARKPHKTSLSCLSQTEVRQRAAALASTLGEPVRILEPPLLLPRAYWTVACQTGDLQIYMALDDATGRLFDLETLLPSQPNAQMVAPINTAAEAREVARHRLQSLQMLPPGSRLGLERPPTRSLSGRSWLMLWQIRYPNAARPCRLTMRLDRRTGLPTEILDLAQAHVYIATK